MHEEVLEDCYICARPLGDEEQDEEHVVPKCLFNSEDRQKLITLPAHKSCNSSFSKDDEYFRLCITAVAYEQPQAQKLWNGPVMRGVHRPQSRGFKTSILNKILPVEVHSQAGLYLGNAEAMLQDPDRIHKVVNRITRGLYTALTKKVLPSDWPVSSDWMPATALSDPGLQMLRGPGRVIGNGTFSYNWKRLDEDDREGLFWLIFYERVVFLGYTGNKIRSRLPWYKEE